eukprot:COSAG01_NODE_9213_length_2517_cov_1.733251_5_plen_62_part_00
MRGDDNTQPQAEAERYIFGLTLLNDWSARCVHLTALAAARAAATRPVCMIAGPPAGNFRPS